MRMAMVLWMPSKSWSDARKGARRAEVAMVLSGPSLAAVACQGETGVATEVSPGATDENGDGIVDAVEVLE